MLKVVVIGLGVGKKHADIYNNDSRCELAGIFDFDSKKKIGQRKNIQVLGFITTIVKSSTMKTLMSFQLRVMIIIIVSRF